VNLQRYKFLNEIFHRVRISAGVDKAVFYSIILRAFSTIGSIITIPLILTRMSLIEQGFYYTFGSILALQVFLEMGFGAVAIQMVAHEAAHLKIDLNSGITGPLPYLDRFSATTRFIRNWYAVISILVGILLFPVGFWFFSSSGSGGSATWLGPWTIMVLVTAGSIFINNMASVIEGAGFVADSIRVRLWGGATQIILTIIGLLIGLRLYAVPLANAVGLIINASFIWKLLHNIMIEIKRYGKGTRINWIADIFPFQWRIALSWISGWFIFNAMLPVIFRQLGPEEAGRYGFGMSISNFITFLATNWLSTKSAIWGQMAARKEWNSMDALFYKVMPQAVGVATLVSAIALLLLPVLKDWVPRFSGRVPEWRVLLTLCLVSILTQLVYAQALYLRAHKREPFLANSIFGAVTMSIGLFCFTHSSAFSISLMYFLLTVLGTIWTSIVFYYCRSHWHCSNQMLR
jgi:hypothetical protein